MASIVNFHKHSKQNQHQCFSNLKIKDEEEKNKKEETLPNSF